LPGRIQRALHELPSTLDATYARSLEEIDEQNWEYAHRLFQCVAAASRPLYAAELAAFLAFDFKVGSTPTFLADWFPEDPAHTVLSTCSSLLAVIGVDGCQVIQFAHFSVKEYLISKRLVEAEDVISRFHVSMTSAHTIVAQACLGFLLHLDKNITKDSLESLPLVEYAAEYWPDHARFNNVSPNILDEMKRLFDPRKYHLSVWLWIYDPTSPKDPFFDPVADRPEKPSLTPLHYAAVCGLCDVAPFLIDERSQDMSSQYVEDDPTPLHLASELGHADFAQLLLERDADITAVDDDSGFTPLGQASYHGHVEVARLLLEYGADMEARDREGSTALLLASQGGYVDVVRVLLQHGANRKARDENGRSPLEWASERGYVGLAQVLLEHGADVKAQNNDKKTPLHIASIYGQLAVAQVLQEHGADLNAQDADGQTPLHLAHGKEVPQFLISHGADVKAQDNDKRTPLHMASRYIRPAAARVLQEHGADPNAQDADGQTPLHLAQGKEVAQFLIDHGADANALDIQGQTPSDIASKRGSVDVVRLLFEHRVDANARDANNATPLHTASGSRS